MFIFLDESGEMDFNYIISNLEVSLALDTNFNIEHECSHNNPGLQAVDLFCWGIYRKYEQRDATWYDLFKHRISSESMSSHQAAEPFMAW